MRLSKSAVKCATNSARDSKPITPKTEQVTWTHNDIGSNVRACCGGIFSELHAAKRNHGVFEADHFYGGGMIGKNDQRKACVRMGLVADGNSGMVFPPELGMPERATSDIMATVVLNAVETAQCLPREIRVDQHQLKTLLEPLAAELGITVRTVKHLPALQEVKRELLSLMGDPGSFMG